MLKNSPGPIPYPLVVVTADPPRNTTVAVLLFETCRKVVWDDVAKINVALSVTDTWLVVRLAVPATEAVIVTVPPTDDTVTVPEIAGSVLTVTVPDTVTGFGTLTVP